MAQVEHPLQIPSEKPPNILEMRDISVSFKKIIALEDVNLTIGRNEVVALLGDNGAGKSTLVKTLMGLYTPKKGSITFNGTPMDRPNPLHAREQGIEVVYQDHSLLEHLSITRNFFLGREITRNIGFLPFLCTRSMDRIVSDQLSEVDISGLKSMRQKPSSLSGGEKQLVEIERANYFCSKLLILDEPTASLSEYEIGKVLNRIRKVQERGIAVLFITHKAHEVFMVADRFVILKRGRNYADLKKSDTTLKDLEKLLISSRFSVVRDMAATVAHQIRNPLGVMKVSVEMLRDDFEVSINKDNYRRILDMILDEVTTLELVARNYLEYANSKAIERTLVAIPELIHGALVNISFDRFPKENINVYVEGDIPPYSVDKFLIEQAIANLVVNAIQASNLDSEITISACLEDFRLVISVTDHGVGMDQDTISNIFNPFFSTKTSGTGLGLSIVQKIIEEHKGKIEVFSEPGRGSVFSIYL